MVARIFRLFSYLYHLAFAFFLFGISVISLSSSNSLHMPFLPWTGQVLTQTLLWGSLLAIISIVLAVTGKFRFLFPFWTLAFLVVMVRGFFLQSYAFESREEFNRILWLTFGAAVAFLASLTLFRPRRPRRY